VVVVVVHLRRKQPLVILTDVLSNNNGVLLTVIPFVASYFARPCKRSPSDALTDHTQRCAGLPSGLLVFRLPLCFGFLFLLHVGPNTNLFPRESDVCSVCRKYFSFIVVAKAFIECLGLIWLIIDAFVLVAVHGSSSNLLEQSSPR